MPTKIMAIAAHPGDALFTMGATVALHIHNGGSGVFLNLSLGERGHPTIPPAEYGEMQRAATEQAAKMLGVDAEFLIYPDAEIPASEQASLAVCDVIREYRPDIIVTHWSGSWHKDHRNTFLIVRDAMFYAALGAMPRKLPAHNVPKLFFAENWEDATDYKPDVSLDITPVYEDWIAACAVFPMWRGETGLIRYQDYYQSLAAMRGSLAGFPYAVALMSGPDDRTRRLVSLGSVEYENASPEVRAVYDDIMQTRNTDWINNFWKALARDPVTLRRTWQSIKEIMAPGALDAVTKEMIYLAVSASNQCGYCIASHTAAARKAGMTDAMFAELMAVVGMANESNRLASGYQVEIDERFKTR